MSPGFKMCNKWLWISQFGYAVGMFWRNIFAILWLAFYGVDYNRLKGTGPGLCLRGENLMKQGTQLTGTVGVPKIPVDNANGKQQSLNLEPHFKDALGKWISWVAFQLFSENQNKMNKFWQGPSTVVSGNTFSLHEFQRFAQRLRIALFHGNKMVTVSLCISCIYDDLIV